MEMNSIDIKNISIFFLSIVLTSGCVTSDEPIKDESIDSEILLNKKEIDELSTKLLVVEKKIAALEAIITKQENKENLKTIDLISIEEVRFEYQKAFDLIKIGEYLAAEEALSTFIDLYSNTEFIDDAIYWLGESFFSQKKYNRALREFEKITTEHPNSEKLIEAILKTGFTQFELGDMKESINTLNELIRNYPDSSASRLAKEKLNSIK